jgi:hypothetical protein
VAKAKFQVRFNLFLTLAAALKTYQNNWQTYEQWASLVWVHGLDVISPVLNQNEEMDKNLIDASIKKDTPIKYNLQKKNAVTISLELCAVSISPPLHKMVSRKTIKMLYHTSSTATWPVLVADSSTYMNKGEKSTQISKQNDCAK